MSITIVTTKGWECTCENPQCGKVSGTGKPHVWRSYVGVTPAICPKCRSRSWNGKKPMGRPPSASVPLTMAKKTRRKR